MRYTTLRVRRAEREPPISQRDVAQAVDMTFDRYWRVEKGYAVPTDDERRALAAFFSTDEAVLFPSSDIEGVTV